MKDKKIEWSDQPAPDEENVPRPSPKDDREDLLVAEPALVYQMDKALDRKISVAEYLRGEEISDVKHEYYKGEIFTMSGAKLSHNFIVRNLLRSLLTALKGHPCQPFTSDLRVHIPSNTLFTYPDISIVCGKPQTLENDQMNLLNPTTLVEVLSRATRKYDQGNKFKLYRDIPTFKEYLLVDSEKVHATVYIRSSYGHWSVEEYHDLTEVLSLDSLNLQIPLTEIYEGTAMIP